MRLPSLPRNSPRGSAKSIGCGLDGPDHPEERRTDGRNRRRHPLLMAAGDNLVELMRRFTLKGAVPDKPHRNRCAGPLKARCSLSAACKGHAFLLTHGVIAKTRHSLRDMLWHRRVLFLVKQANCLTFCSIRLLFWRSQHCGCGLLWKTLLAGNQSYGLAASRRDCGRTKGIRGGGTRPTAPFIP